jgi:hypothetical protein
MTAKSDSKADTNSGFIIITWKSRWQTETHTGGVADRDPGSGIGGMGSSGDTAFQAGSPETRAWRETGHFPQQ